MGEGKEKEEVECPLGVQGWDAWVFRAWGAEKGDLRSLDATGGETCQCGPRAGQVRMCYGVRAVDGCTDGGRAEVLGWGAPLALGVGGVDQEVRPVARLRGFLVHRPRCGWNFLDVAASCSDDAGACARALCRRDGAVDERRAPECAAPGHADAGGCFFLDSLHVSEVWRGDDVGLHLLHAVLKWLLQQEDGLQWTLAAARPWRVPSAAEDLRAEEQMRYFRAHGEKETLDAAGRERLKMEQALGDAEFRKIQVQFHRCGFRQARPCGDVWFLLPSRFPPNAKALPGKREADAVLARPSAPTRPAEPHPADAALLKFLGQGMRYPGPNAFRCALQALVGPGREADAGRCLALHAAVRSGFSSRGCFAVLVELGAPVDGADHAGRTALHAAAARLDIAQVEALLALGASAAARDVHACTPLDAWRDARDDCIERAALRGIDAPLDDSFDDAEDLLIQHWMDDEQNGKGNV